MIHLIKKFQEKKAAKLEQKLHEHHENVLDMFAQHGFNISPVFIGTAPQDEIKKFVTFERFKCNIYHDPSSHINGIYVTPLDMILLDRNLIADGSEKKIERVIAHEHMHRLYGRFIRKVHERSSQAESPQQRTFDEAFKEYVDHIKRLRLTETERRRWEFDIYFEEMLVQSAALYLIGRTNAEKFLTDYSRGEQGEFLGQDRQYFAQLEQTLIRAFYDRLFTRGLRNVLCEAPVVYNHARAGFEKRYRQQVA